MGECINLLYAEFEKAIKLDADISDVYRFIANNFGTRSLLLLIVSKPSSYHEPQEIVYGGIDTIPGISPDSRHPLQPKFLTS